MDCRPTVSICEKCHKEGHSSHFVENLSNDDMQDLIDIKKDEMTQMFRDLRRYFDVQHSLLQLFEEEKKREIIKVYEERIKAIDPTKPLKNVSAFDSHGFFLLGLSSLIYRTDFRLFKL